MHSDTERSIEDQERMAACGRVNFISNFAKHENIINLFTCTGWRRAYPDLFGAIGKIKGSDWDHIYVPIGKEFFDDRERRDRVFKYIKELDSKDGLDDLARVVTSLNETNFYDSLHVLFQCANTPDSKECKERAPNLLSKEQIKNIFRFMMIDSDLYAHSSNIIRNVVGAIGDDSEVIRTETLEFYKKTSFIKLRLSLVSRLLNTALKGITNEDRSFIAKIFFTITKEDGKPWLHRWFTNEKLTNDQFSRLFKYPVSTNPEFIKDSLALNNAFESRLMCKTDLGEGNIEIDVKHHLEKFLSRLSHSNFKEFMEYALQNTGTLVSAKHFVRFWIILKRISATMMETVLFSLKTILSSSLTWFQAW